MCKWLSFWNLFHLLQLESLRSVVSGLFTFYFSPGFLSELCTRSTGLVPESPWNRPGTSGFCCLLVFWRITYFFFISLTFLSYTKPTLKKAHKLTWTYASCRWIPVRDLAFTNMPTKKMFFQFTWKVGLQNKFITFQYSKKKSHRLRFLRRTCLKYDFFFVQYFPGTCRRRFLRRRCNKESIYSSFNAINAGRGADMLVLH